MSYWSLSGAEQNSKFYVITSQNVRSDGLHLIAGDVIHKTLETIANRVRTDAKPRENLHLWNFWYLQHHRQQAKWRPIQSYRFAHTSSCVGHFICNSNLPCSRKHQYLNFLASPVRRFAVAVQKRRKKETYVLYRMAWMAATPLSKLINSAYDQRVSQLLENSTRNLVARVVRLGSASPVISPTSALFLSWSHICSILWRIIVAHV